ncbi:2,3,4,5-tetrahydropyridine-2,6-dicarboxylate N-acetyltransferase [Kingella potus]|uniref:2,3,4,5-tetrahydropyridine-2,6-dicarboxylate N-acetyltransferase n=1 Tax=Kingella potus TaxID=265175 RepID=A0A377R013_9NEIS|nr:acetyltransferase [Kingella potus]STR00976.1 2,3,4,5-tetrahydropyridine-2,6-dicarboxylate N-acetyltransferase [Kingella potus]
MNTDTNADKLVIIGAGGHGKVLAATALAAGRWAQIVFLDDGRAAGDTVLGLPVLGGTPLLGTRLTPDAYQAAVAVGDNAARQKLFGRLKTLGFTLPDIVHPSAVVAPYAALGGGCAVFAQAVIQPGSRIGEGCIVNTAATVDHDCTLGAFVHISPGAHLAGGTQVGAGSWIGIGACTRQQVRIGSGATVGAGAAVVGDIADGLTVAGVPARALQ